MPFKLHMGRYGSRFLIIFDYPNTQLHLLQQGAHPGFCLWCIVEYMLTKIFHLFVDIPLSDKGDPFNGRFRCFFGSNDVLDYQRGGGGLRGGWPPLGDKQGDKWEDKWRDTTSDGQGVTGLALLTLLLDLVLFILVLLLNLVLVWHNQGKQDSTLVLLGLHTQEAEGLPAAQQQQQCVELGQLVQSAEPERSFASNRSRVPGAQRWQWHTGKASCVWRPVLVVLETLTLLQASSALPDLSTRPRKLGELRVISIRMGSTIAKTQKNTVDFMMTQ